MGFCYTARTLLKRNSKEKNMKLNVLRIFSVCPKTPFVVKHFGCEGSLMMLMSTDFIQLFSICVIRWQAKKSSSFHFNTTFVKRKKALFVPSLMKRDTFDIIRSCNRCHLSISFMFVTFIPLISV